MRRSWESGKAKMSRRHQDIEDKEAEIVAGMQGQRDNPTTCRISCRRVASYKLSATTRAARSRT